MNDNLENDLSQGGGAGQPSGTASPTGGSLTSNDIEALKQSLKAELKAELAGLQSNKDKRIQSLSDQQEVFQSQLEQFQALVKDGMTESQALRWMNIEERLSGMSNATAGNGVSAGGTSGPQSQQTNAGMSVILSSLGLDANGQEELAILREKANDPIAQVAALANLAANRKSASKPTANPAQIMSSAGGTSAPDLLTDYRKAVAAIPRGVNAPRMIAETKKAFRDRAREAGVELDI